MKNRFRQLSRWMGAWVLGTGTVYLAREIPIPWPIALLVGGLVIGVAEAIIERDNPRLSEATQSELLDAHGS